MLSSNELRGHPDSQWLISLNGAIGIFTYPNSWMVMGYPVKMDDN